MALLLYLQYVHHHKQSPGYRGTECSIADFIKINVVLEINAPEDLQFFEH